MNKETAVTEFDYKIVIERLPDPVVVHAEGQIIFVNQASADLLGYHREQLAAMPIRSLIHPDDIPTFQERQELLDAGQQPPIQELRALRHDGAFVWVEVHAYTADFSAKNARVVVARDISARKRAEAEVKKLHEELENRIDERTRQLAASKARFSGIVENAFDAIITIDQDEQIILWNHSAERDFGYTPEEAIGSSLSMLIPERFRSDHPGLIKKFSRESGESRMMEARGEIFGIRKNGEEFPAEASISKLDLEGRKFFTVHLSDLTGRKKAEATLHESEEQVRLLLDSTAEAILGLDLDGRCTFCNPACLLILGYENESDLIGNNIHDLIHHTHADGRHYYNMDCEIYKAFRTGEKVHVADEVFWRADGTSFPTEYWSYPIRRNGKIIGSVVTFLDVTERAETQRALEESTAQQRQSQKMEAVGRLAGGIAHDFNNLLTAINGYSEMILDDLRPDDPLYENVRDIHIAGGRAATLTSRLLAFSREEAVDPKTLNLVDVVYDLKSMLHRLIGEDITLEVESPSILPPVIADRGHIEQVVVNLVVNARDAISGRGEITIELGARGTPEDKPAAENGNVPESVFLKVRDTGSGMDEETISKMFDPFFTTKEEGKGTGLGLSTVFGIVEQSGGTISVESELGKGTAFTISFSVPQTREETEKGKEAPSKPIGGSETILLIERDDLVRSLAKQVLGKLGYEVLAASAGEEALALAEHHAGTIPIVVTDVVLSDMKGDEVSSRLAAFSPSIKTLFVAGAREEILELQAQTHRELSSIEKPFVARDIGQMVRKVLDGPAAASGLDQPIQG